MASGHRDLAVRKKITPGLFGNKGCRNLVSILHSEGEGPEDSGSIVASYKGQHGWYWLNIADQPVILELEVAGFYDKIISVSTEY